MDSPPEETPSEGDAECTGKYHWIDSFLCLSVEALVRSRLQRHASHAGSEFLHECSQEAAIRLWKARERIHPLTDAEREAYARVCIQHVVADILIREARRRDREVALAELDTNRGATAGTEEWRLLREETLLECVERPDLATLLRALRPEDRQILDFYYLHDFTDLEIAERLGKSVAAIKMQRRRTILRLRRMIARGHPVDAA